MGKARPRYNEKARASSRKSTQRPHPHARNGGLGITEGQMPETSPNDTQSDSNALMIIPDKDKEKQEKVEIVQPVKPMTKKKKKRLEKYIEKKLKKDARVDLMQQLATSSWSSDLLQSSKLIGRTTLTAKERIRQAFLEDKSGIKLHGSDDDSRLFVERTIEEPVEKIAEEPEEMSATLSSHVEAEETEKAEQVADVKFGSALQATEDGTAQPMMVKKKRKKKKSTIPEEAKKRFKLRRGELDSDTSFDSSDSEYDKSDDEIEPPQKQDIVDASEEISGPSALEEVVEAAKRLTVPFEPRQEEEDDQVKLALLKQNREGDLSNDVAKPFYVPVKRSADIQEARMKLPICGEEQTIMEAIRNNTVVIICGETGSGKTTQVPQFLYEAGWSHPDSDNPGLIGVTQPRRVAAVSMARRVGEEMNLPAKQISHQIRYDVTVSSETRIKFMTDGVLLRELADDLLLRKYSVIIIDEAHERNLNTDILIGIISRVLKLRAELSREDRQKIKPLRVVIMSATLRVSDFTENTTLFPVPPPVINVEARQYSVSVHFNRRTPDDYVADAFRKISRIHKRLPPGGILVFLTGQNEITHLCKQLRKKFPFLAKTATRDEIMAEKAAIKNETKTESVVADKADVEVEDVTLGDTEDVQAFDLDTDSEDDDEDDYLGFDEDELQDDSMDAPLHVLPLFSMLPTEAQLRVFQPPPEGSRLCVIATNVAETSITIPGIRYVVDVGKAKERQYDAATGAQSFVIDWTSQASSGQRAGRAGRTGPGHCYRLYSSAVFDQQFPKFSLPEIERMPIEGVVLSMKAMNIDNIINFPFPTPPPRERLTKAEQLLGYLGAIDPQSKRITDFGRTMALFPIAPRFAKMLLIGHQHNCLPFVIAIVSALSVGDPFVQDYQLDQQAPEDEPEEKDQDGDPEIQVLRKEEVAEKERRRQRRKQFYSCQAKHAGLDPTSDILKLLNVVGAYEYAGATTTFCEENFLRPKAMEEIGKLRQQLTNIVAAHFPQIDICIDPKMKPPSALQRKVLRQVIAAGYLDSVAVRVDVRERGGRGLRYKNAHDVPYRTMHGDEDAFIHPNSVLYAQEPPAFLVYNELFQSRRPWLKGITAVEYKWLESFGNNVQLRRMMG